MKKQILPLAVAAIAIFPLAAQAAPGHGMGMGHSMTAPGIRNGPAAGGMGRRVGPPSTHFGKSFAAPGTKPGRRVGPPSAPLGKGKGKGLTKKQ